MLRGLSEAVPVYSAKCNDMNLRRHWLQLQDDYNALAHEDPELNHRDETIRKHACCKQ